LAVVDQLSFPRLTEMPERLAAAFGAAPRLCTKTRYPSGESPVLLLNEAAERIRVGEIEVAAVVGGEALRTAARRAAAAAGDKNAVREAAARSAKPLRQKYGLVAPTDVYPLYENASRTAFGQTLAQGQRESAEIWSRFSQVAAANEHAWLRKPVTPEEILTPSPQNRPIAFPYTKLMVANASVNQGAGFIVTSLAKARAMGVAEERLVFVGYGAAAREPSDVLAREGYDRSIALETSLHKALAFNGLDARDLDAIELYSCFPCIPKLARRVVHWPIDRPMSVAGGLTFAGGPVGNYMSHAIAAMTERLRRDGRTGLLFGNGGFANTNHCIVLARDPSSAEPHNFNVQADADAQRGEAPALVEEYAGPGRVETYTILHDREGAAQFGVVVARTPRGERFLARIEGADVETVARLASATEEPVGAEGVSARRGELNHWRFT
ncbi:MAG TPA: acetyl-CoA acetyltransferase, partial [Candidatus Binatia bacterium]|nr:acetyl-CoA acetyltransferase [Candidatus Binatia bacterium]